MKRSIQIKESISSDGLGVPSISVYFSLCDKKRLTGSFCKNCHNKEIQEKNIGYTLELKDAINIIENKIVNFKKIFGKCDLVLVGGEPFAKENRLYSFELAKYFKDKGINSTVYTWRKPKQIKKEQINIENYNKVVCGEYIEELNNDNYLLGSTNQKIINNKFKTILKYEGDDEINEFMD